VVKRKGPQVAYIHKPSFVDKHGKRRKLRCWYIYYKDAAGKRVKVKGFRDRGATEIRRREIEKQLERAEAGLPVAQLDRQLSEVLDMYESDIRRIGRNHDYVRIKVGRIRKIAREIPWTTLRSLTAESLREWLGEAAAKGRAASTLNQDRGVVGTFANWCVRQGYLTENPVRRVQSVRQLCAGPRARRAYTPDEFARLVAASPPARAEVYRLAAMSGMRRKEIRLMTTADFTLGDSPRWHMRASVAKGRRVDTVPMLPGCVAILAGRKPYKRDRLFRVPSDAELAADLAAAGIPRVIDGRWVGFHSLRYYFCTQLATHLPIQIVQRLMRHKSITMTADLYCDLGIHQLELQLDMKAIDALFR